jgi:hypothetical protein
MSGFVIEKIIGLSGSFVGLSGFWLIIGFLVENLNDMSFLAFKKFLALLKRLSGWLSLRGKFTTFLLMFTTIFTYVTYFFKYVTYFLTCVCYMFCYVLIHVLQIRFYV